MKKMVLIIGLLFLSVASFSQNDRIARDFITVDSLTVMIKNTLGVAVYYIPDNHESKIYDINTSRADFEKHIRSKLQSAGYSITIDAGNWLILKGVGINSELPKGYFRAEESVIAEEPNEYLKSLIEKSETAVSNIKIYEIGNKIVRAPGGKVEISGIVRDIQTGAPASDIIILDVANNTQAISDEFGRYKMLVPIGEVILQISSFFVEEYELNLNVHGAGVLDIGVNERIHSLEGAVVSAERTDDIRSARLGQEMMRIERIKTIPVAFGEADVLKTLLTLPGVKSVGDAAGGFNVRGGATDQNLVLFNGGTIYNANHLFGIFSAFNPDFVSEMELYKSSIPAKYGGRISSVLEVVGKDGSDKKIEGSAGIGLLTGKAHLEGPLGKSKKTTFMIGGRSTYSNWILGLLPEDSEYRNGSASFWDVNANIKHKMDSLNWISAYAYYSHDDFAFNQDTTYQYNNISASLRGRFQVAPKSSMVINGVYDRYSYNYVSKGQPAYASKLDFNVDQVTLRAGFETLLGDKHTLSYGVNALYYNVVPGIFQPEGQESIIEEKVLETERAVEAAFYVSDSWNISDKFLMEYGMRYGLYYSFNGEKFYNSPELRLSTRYMLSEYASIKVGFNNLTQNIHMLSKTTTISPTDVWKLSDDKIRPQKGWQAAIGGYTSFMANNLIDLSVEAYYKSMNNYLDYKSGATIIMNEKIDEDVVETIGRAYGIEFMLKKMAGSLSGWASYTYSRTQLREDGDRGDAAINKGEWYNASYDKPHDFKVVGNYKITHRYSVSANLDYSTGRPVTVPIGKYYYGGGYRLYYSNRNEYRVPDYFRLDLALNVEPRHKLTQLTYFSITLGVYNVTGRKNAYSVFYRTEGGEKIRGYKLTVFGAPIPYLSINMRF